MYGLLFTGMNWNDAIKKGFEIGKYHQERNQLDHGMNDRLSDSARPPTTTTKNFMEFTI